MIAKKKLHSEPKRKKNRMLILSTLCTALQLQLCTHTQPNNNCVRTVADSFSKLNEHNVKLARVYMNDMIKDNITISVDLICNKGLRTYATGEGCNVKEACTNSIDMAISNIMNRLKMNSMEHMECGSEKCYVIHDLRN